MLAALPKAPNNYNPLKKPRAAKGRRDWVVDRMLEDGVITPEAAAAAKARPLSVRRRGVTEFVNADYFAEEVRRELVQRYGEDELYKGGLSVRTTLSPRLQGIADRALRAGLEAYDRRHGWRGPIDQVGPVADWLEQLAKVEEPKGLGLWRLGIVLSADDKSANIGVDDGRAGTIPLDELKWARAWKKKQRLGPRGIGRRRRGRGPGGLRDRGGEALSGQHLRPQADPRDRRRGGGARSPYGARAGHVGRLFL